MALGTDRSVETMWSLLSVCPLRPPTDVAVAVKSGWILSMLPPVVAVLGLLYCANFASVILGEVRNTHTKRNSILNRISGRDKGNLLHPAGYGARWRAPSASPWWASVSTLPSCMRGTEPTLFAPGTEGSNLAPSSAES